MLDSQSDLLRDVAELLVQAGDLEGKVDPTTLKAEDQIFGLDSPLGLDSLDALEVVFAVQGRFGVRLDDKNTARQVLRTVGSLHDFIEAQKAGS